MAWSTALEQNRKWRKSRHTLSLQQSRQKAKQGFDGLSIFI